MTGTNTHFKESSFSYCKGVFSLDWQHNFYVHSCSIAHAAKQISHSENVMFSKEPWKHVVSSDWGRIEKWSQFSGSQSWGCPLHVFMCRQVVFWPRVKAVTAGFLSMRQWLYDAAYYYYGDKAGANVLNSFHLLLLFVSCLFTHSPQLSAPLWLSLSQLRFLLDSNSLPFFAVPVSLLTHSYKWTRACWVTSENP